MLKQKVHAIFKARNTQTVLLAMPPSLRKSTVRPWHLVFDRSKFCMAMSVFGSLVNQVAQQNLAVLCTGLYLSLGTCNGEQYPYKAPNDG